MAAARENNSPRKRRREPIPPGATTRAAAHDLRPGEPADRVPGGTEAVGTPGGGTEVGGLAGTNIDDGSPHNANLDRAMGSDDRGPDSEDGGPPYAGHAGGAVGGTPAGKRSSGDRVNHGIDPEDEPHVESTIGQPPKRRRRRKEGER
jgi:hypothetical protein